MDNPLDPDLRRLAGGQGETLEGLQSLSVDVEEVRVVHRSDPDDPSTEQVITLPDTGGLVDLVEGDIDEAPRQILYLEVPEGFVMQVRIIVRSATITNSDGSTAEVSIPSGDTSGLKIVPAEGEPPFEVVADGRSAVSVRLNLFKQLIRNQG
ncbi:MAG: hypothetical protein CO108_12305, partial [Deltaproteobacteria bacterium CG_4_9_14_3_um_filter_63_12]